MVLQGVMNKLILPLFLFVSSLLHALPGDNSAPINVKAQTVVIDESSGLSVYTGGAKVSKGSLILSAEEIQIFSDKNVVKKIIAKGNKKKRAYYKQNQSNQPRFVEAQALKITYFVNKQLVRLEGDAHLVQGFDSFSGGVLHYNIKEDKMIAKRVKDSTQQVKFKIKL